MEERAEGDASEAKQQPVPTSDAYELILPDDHPKVKFRGVYTLVPNKMANGKQFLKQTDGATYLYYDGKSVDIIPIIEFFSEDDQYACYEYLTSDIWPKGASSAEFDEWRTNKTKLHRVHLEAGSKIPLAHKAAQAFSILPEAARWVASMEIRQKVENILIFNIKARGKYDFLVDPEQTA